MAPVKKGTVGWGGINLKELSLHILDLGENAIRAGADLIQISVEENLQQDFLSITISDNGCGMAPDFLEKALDPFTTTRQTRRVGLGLPFFKAAAEECNGSFEITSTLGKGTRVKGTFQHSHIDRMPLGNMVETMITLILANEKIDYEYCHIVNNRKFCFNTKEIKQVLKEVPLTDISVISWIKDYLESGLKEIMS